MALEFAVCVDNFGNKYKKKLRCNFHNLKFKSWTDFNVFYFFFHHNFCGGCRPQRYSSRKTLAAGRLFVIFENCRQQAKIEKFVKIKRGKRLCWSYFFYHSKSWNGKENIHLHMGKCCHLTWKTCCHLSFLCQCLSLSLDKRQKLKIDGGYPKDKKLSGSNEKKII